MDKTITCIDCGLSFTFTEGEQDYYSKKGFNPPKRCKKCRAQRKAANNDGNTGNTGIRSFKSHDNNSRKSHF
ncbi:zinc-ribbon domain-containing protein [Candidatus Babeliales bacterium]|nr:zinc-ribbon domain-containing protein [Candidatus Babeliales bacterium]